MSLLVGLHAAPCFRLPPPRISTRILKESSVSLMPSKVWTRPLSSRSSPSQNPILAPFERMWQTRATTRRAFWATAAKSSNPSSLLPRSSTFNEVRGLATGRSTPQGREAARKTKERSSETILDNNVKKKREEIKVGDNVMHIDSSENLVIKTLKRLATEAVRKKEQRMVIEGERLFAAALGRGWRPECVVCAPDKLKSVVRAVSPTTPVRVAPADLVVSAMQLDHLEAIVAYGPAPLPRARAVFTHAVLLFTQDAQNLGSILRSAAAFGIDTVYAGPGCADPFSLRALRSSAGAAFDLQYGPYAGLQESLQRGEVSIFTANAHGGVRALPIAGSLMPASHNDTSSEEKQVKMSKANTPFDWAGQHEVTPKDDDKASQVVVAGPGLVRPSMRTLLVLGHETRGVPDEWVARGTSVTIPVVTESLSVSCAATLMLYLLHGARIAATQPPS
eukprot:m.147458 g.147458  ORF g.147458 m.147458 type:complete len:449 (+) comp15039_c0_seq2:87-1433(+)